MRIKLIAELVSQLNLAALRKVRMIKVKYNKVSLIILRILYSKGCILNYKVKDTSFNNKIIEVYLKFGRKNGCVYKKISLINKNMKISIKSKKTLYTYFHKKNWSGFFVISTNLGYFTSEDLILLSQELTIGGKLLFRVVF